MLACSVSCLGTVRKTNLVADMWSQHECSGYFEVTGIIKVEVLLRISLPELLK
jgi:hypothetical protein